LTAAARDLGTEPSGQLMFDGPQLCPIYPLPLAPSIEKADTTGVLPAGGSGGQMPPPPNPPLGNTAPENRPPQPKRDGYVDFF
jgi:hypothetical protein